MGDFSGGRGGRGGGGIGAIPCGTGFPADGRMGGGNPYDARYGLYAITLLYKNLMFAGS